MPVELAAGSHELAMQNRLDIDGVDGTYGSFSGAGSLTLSKGTFVCYRTSTFAGGFVAKSGTTVLVFADSSLGTGLATFEAKSLLTIYKECTLPNDFVFAGRADGNNDLTFRTSATFSGNVTLGAQVRIAGTVDVGAELRFTGTLSTPEASSLLISQNGNSRRDLVFESPMSYAAGQLWGTGAGDVFRFCAAGNAIGLIRLQVGSCRFEVPGACDPNGALTLYSNAGAAIFCEGAQETKRLYSTDVTLGGGHSVTSSTGGSLKVNAVQDSTFVGALTGPLSFIWNPSGAYTFNAKGDCSLSGAFVVSNGTVNVSAAGALANVSAITVSAGATLSLADGVTVNPCLDRLDLSKTGTFVVPGTMMVFDVGVLYVDGVQQAEDTVFTGGVPAEGQVHLDALPANVTVSTRIVPGVGTRHEWNGAGLSNDLLTNDANWWGGKTPAFGPKCLMAVVGGESATVAEATELNGVTLENGSNFAFGGTGLLDIYWAGFSVTNGNSSVLTMNAPVRLCGEQTWSVGSGERLVFNAEVSDNGEAPVIVKTGRGVVEFHAENTFTGDLIVSNGGIQVFHDEPLGDPTVGRVVFRHADADNPSSIASWAQDVRISRPLSFEGAGDYFNSVAVANGHVLELAGPVSVIGGSRWFYTDSSSTIVCSGGVFGDNQFVVDAGHFVLTNAPSSLASNFYISRGDVTVACSNNACAEVCLYTSSTKMMVATDCAFTNRPGLRTVSSPCLDLCGHDLQVGRIYGEANADKTDVRVTSAEPALLDVVMNGVGSVVNAVFSGAASLRSAGATFNLVGGISVSTGALECAGGTLTMKNAAAWTAGSVLCQNDGATLVVSDSAAFGRKVDVYVGKGGKLDLRKDVVCRNVYFWKNDRWVEQGFGTYGSSASAADTKSDDYFVATGTGVLRAVHGGAVIILR